jgi:subtilase family serine protease
MRMRSLLPRLVGAVVLCAAVPAITLAQALVHNRIAAGVNDSARAVIAHNTNPRALHATDLGLVPANTPLSSMTLRFNMTPEQDAALTQLNIAQQNPASPQYRQWLTPQQYGAEFGLSASDISAVTGWLAAKGFSNITVAQSETFVRFSGTAAQAQAAFATPIHSVSANGSTYFASLVDPTLPAGIAGVVSSVTGLNSFHLQPRARVRTVPAPQYTSSVSGSTYIAPGDFYTIYNIQPLLNNSINGTGITIGVMGQTDISLPSAAAFRSVSGLTANPPTVMLYGTDPGTSTNDLPEAMLDVEWSGAVAPSATILYVNSTDVIDGSLTQAIDHNLAPILTISYGDCEQGFGSANLATFNAMFRQAVTQGQTILGPAGDSGATDCDYDATAAVSGLAVDFPASSPSVTGLGGTMFNENGGTYFSATNGTTQGSALSYIPEAVWNETAVQGTLASGGGGFSSTFVKPYWQVGNGVPADSSRDVPDLSFNAAADHDGYLLCVPGYCTNGYRNAAGTLSIVGGTSVATPSFAGIMALLEQKIATRVGNANPTIYGLANSTYYGTVFNDVATGTNAQPCTAGTTDCPNGGTIGYAAGVGYDRASGWGSLNVQNFVTDWPLVTPIANNGFGSDVSSTMVTESAASVLSGTTVTVTAAIASNTPNVTTTPTGTAQLLIDNVASGSPSAVTNGSVTFSVSTTSLSSGNHYLTVAYSGDVTYNGSKGTVNLDVVSSTSPDFGLTPASTNITTATGTTAPGVTFTVTPVGGFTGNVTFVATTTSSSLAATYSFSVSPVVISGTAAGSTVFTLEAYTSAADVGTGLNKFGPVKAASNRSPFAPWEMTGSGVAMAGLLLLCVPRRRRSLGLVLVALLSIGVFAVSGCSEGSGSTSTPTTTTTTTTTNTAPGTYTITVSASGVNSAGTHVTHNSQVTFVVH